MADKHGVVKRSKMLHAWGFQVADDLISAQRHARANSTLAYSSCMSSASSPAFAASAYISSTGASSGIQKDVRGRPLPVRASAAVASAVPAAGSGGDSSPGSFAGGA